MVYDTLRVEIVDSTTAKSLGGHSGRLCPVPVLLVDAGREKGFRLCDQPGSGSLGESSAAPP
jgi:hypothetical protein